MFRITVFGESDTRSQSAVTLVKGSQSAADAVARRLYRAMYADGLTITRVSVLKAA